MTPEALVGEVKVAQDAARCEFAHLAAAHTPEQPWPDERDMLAHAALAVIGQACGEELSEEVRRHRDLASLSFGEQKARMAYAEYVLEQAAAAIARLTGVEEGA